MNASLVPSVRSMRLGEFVRSAVGSPYQPSFTVGVAVGSQGFPVACASTTQRRHGGFPLFEANHQACSTLGPLPTFTYPSRINSHSRTQPKGNTILLPRTPLCVGSEILIRVWRGLTNTPRYLSPVITAEVRQAILRIEACIVSAIV
jgi:hypothetical protein